MLFCERCKKRPAMIFVQQMENGAMKSKGYCLTCAKELGIKPVDDMISQMGLDDETLKGLEEQMQGIMNGDGEDGENGKVQATFDMHGIKYTGSGYLGSAIAMNKEITKIMLRNSGIPVPEGIVLEKGGELKNVGFPCVVKPCSGGSSVGTSMVANEEEYAAALELAFKYEDHVLVERFIKGRELTVGVMGGKAMPVIEIIPKTGWYDYKNKYQAGLTEEICPAPISEKDTDRVQRLAERVSAALMVDVYCRADFLMDNASGEIYCLEANTLPGMTPTSLIPQMGREEGLDFGEVCEKIIKLSMEKY